MEAALSTTGRRRRFDAGGPVAQGQPSAPLSQPPAGMSDTDTAAAVLSQPVQGQQDADSQGRRIDAATQRLNTMGILAAAGMANPTWMRPGATNIPQLAAAGAMLAPTRTGGFAESLGNAFTAASGATEAQRKLEAENQMRLAQLADTSAYREGILGVRGQHEDSYAARATTYSQLAQAQAAKDQAQAAYATARAAMAGASHATEGDVLNQTVKSLADGKTVNPTTGQPWQLADAYRFVKGLDIRQENADTGKQRLALGQQNLTLRQTAYETARDDRERALVEKSTDEDLQRATSIMNTDRANGGKMALSDALAQVTAARPSPRPTLPAAPAAGGTQQPQGGPRVWPGAPAVGTQHGNFTYKGGNPADPASWAQMQPGPRAP